MQNLQKNKQMKQGAYKFYIILLSNIMSFFLLILTLINYQNYYLRNIYFIE
jgi:hypothetical protein